MLDDIDNTKYTEKLDLPICNDSVTSNKKKKSRDDSNDEETNKDSESSSYNIEEAKEKSGTHFRLKNIPTIYQDTQGYPYTKFD